MKNIIFKSVITLAASAFVLTGCIKETFPEGSTVTVSQLSESSDAIKGLLNSIPAAMVTTGTTGYLNIYNHHGDFGIGEIHLITENMLEDFVTLAANPYYNRNYNWGMNKYQGEDYWYCSYFWDCYYPWIKICNDVISSLTAVGEPAVGSEQAGLLAQAYAYRAYFYLDLARLYEYKNTKYEKYNKPELVGLTVPIVTDKTTEQEAGNNPRVKSAEMYDFILTDLANAAKFFVGTSVNVYEPNKNLVNGLFARAYLEMGANGINREGEDSYALAAEYADLVINAGYSPLTQEQWEDPTNGFNNATANSSWLWGLGITAENYNNICTYAAFICSEGQWGYAPLVQLGVSNKLYNLIPDEDFRKHSWLDPAGLDYYDYKLSGSEKNQADFINGSEEQQIPAAADYESIKFRPATGNCTDYNVGNATDQCMMRIEEMYFIKAEALAASSVSEGAAVLNEFMKTYRYSSYNCSASTKEAFLEELLLQKRIEFWGEGILIFDYKRLDHGIERGYEGTLWPSDWCFNSEGRSPQWNIVITRSETQTNKGVPATLNNPDPTDFTTLWTAK